MVGGDKPWENHGKTGKWWLDGIMNGIYPLVMTDSLLLKMAIEIGDKHPLNMVIFQFAMFVYQRVYKFGGA